MEDGETQERGGVKRVHLIISGDVQGVGFRAWVVDQAQDLRLVGWVKNRDDGTVEIVAEGVRNDLDEFIKACHHGPEVADVVRVDVDWQTATGEFVEFAVIY